MTPLPVLPVACRVGRTLEGLGVPWLVGGSVASSLQGVPRSTQDVDLVADLRNEHIRQFIEELEPEFYLSEDAIIDAIKRRSCFNIIHFDSTIKIDIFIPGIDLRHPLISPRQASGKGTFQGWRDEGEEVKRGDGTYPRLLLLP